MNQITEFFLDNNVTARFVLSLIDDVDLSQDLEDDELIETEAAS